MVVDEVGNHRRVLVSELVLDVGNCFKSNRGLSLRVGAEDCLWRYLFGGGYGFDWLWFRSIHVRITKPGVATLYTGEVGFSWD